MNKLKTLDRSILTLLALALIGLIAYWISLTSSALGSAPSGLNLSTTTPLSYADGLVSASATVGVLFQASRNCGSRTITTASSSVRIGISSTTPSAVSGLLQAASTTTIYDSGLYGCGMWQVFGFSPAGTAAAHTISIEEIR